ncbi:site-specific integrase, partial [uncultured Oscillibacter sp.]|uniref:site-specific integrase n=2 Tax=uncultured Oscillibacter sp. TaxID=876091 RepID=UPI00272A79E2
GRFPMPRLRFLRPSTGLGLEKRGIYPRIWSFIGRFLYLCLFAWLLLVLISASLSEFCTRTGQSESMAETSLNVARSAIRRFLFEMEDHGFRSLADFTQMNVNGCVTSFASHYAGGLGAAIYSVRVFLHFLFEDGVTDIDLSLSLPELVATRKMFREGFTESELEHLLEHPDRFTAIGKRDYAMMVLAAQSGLRACDVVRLKLDSIDWRTREIRLVQHKTGEPLSLPLEAESGNAIADYILHGRPDSTHPNIFLCHTGVIRPLDARSASGVVSKHMKLVGIPAKHRAFHALRRTFGTRLLQNEVSFELIQQLLGHRDMDSMKLYLSIDEQGLKQCALPLLSYGRVGN